MYAMTLRQPSEFALFNNAIAMREYTYEQAYQAMYEHNYRIVWTWGPVSYWREHGWLA